MIARWFCEQHPQAMLYREKDSAGRPMVRVICRECRRSRLGEIMAELQAAQWPLTYRTHRTSWEWKGKLVYVVRRIPVAPNGFSVLRLLSGRD